MEYLTDDVVKKVLRYCGESDDVEEIVNCKSVAAVGNAENFCSNISRIHFQVKLKSGKVFNKTLVIKAFLKGLSQDAHREIKKHFHNEAIMYLEILKPLGNLAKEHGLKPSIIWPNCYSANTDFVVFDDLKEDGFISPPRLDGLNVEDAIQVIRSLGRLHALSLIGVRRKLINPDLLRETNTWAELGNFTAHLVKRVTSEVGDIVSEWGDQWYEAGKKIKDISSNLSQILNDLNKEDVSIKVVNHGDPWITNILLKYDQKLTCESLRFVDFQNSNYNSIGWDIVYFLYSSMKAEHMRSNYDILLTSYKSEFVDTLQRLGEDPSLAPTIEDIKADIVRLHPFCLFVACSLNATTFNTCKEHVTADELLTNPVKLRNLHSSENWKSSMKHNIKYFQQQKFL